MLFLLLTSLLPSVLSSYPPCFNEGFTWPHDDVLDGFSHVNDPYECQELAAKVPGAEHFTWNGAGILPNFCVVFRAVRSPVACNDGCVSGPTACPRCSGEYSCVVGEDNLLDYQPGVATELECQATCFNTKDCLVYTWYSDAASIYHHDCFLFSSCPQTDESCTGCFTGPAECGGSTTETPAPTTTKAPAPTTTKAPSPTTTKAPAPTTTKAPAPTTTKAPAPTTTKAPAPTTTKAPAPTTTQAPAPTTTITPPPPTTTKVPAPTTTITPQPTTTKAPAPTTTKAPAPTSTKAPTPTTTPAPDCSVPPPQSHGYWHCSIDPISIPVFECFLECHSGYVPSNNSVTGCSGGSWTTPPEQLICSAGVALVTGGFNDGAKRSAEVYSADGSCDMVLPDLPDDRTDHTVDLVDGHVILCGGDYTQTTCILLGIDLMWEPYTSTNQVRYDHSSISAMGQLILLGGRYATTESLSPRSGNSWVDGYPLQEKTRYACSVKVSPDSYIVVGGQNFPNHVSHYNVSSGYRGRFQNLGTGRWLHGCTLVHNNTVTGVLVAGGYDAGDELGSSEMYHLEEGRWQQAGDLNTARHSLELVQVKDKVLAIGGNAGEDFLDTVEEFEIASSSWKQVKGIRQPRASHAVTVVPQNRLADICE